MSQRIRRAQDRNNIDGATFSSGGFVVHHDRNEDPVVRVPQKTTGEVPAEKLSGIAKASPFFKPLEEVKPKSKAEEKKALAESVEKVLKPEDEKEKTD